MLLLSSLTVCSQTTSQDSLKCFTYEQARTIFKDLKKGQLCDSIRGIQSLQIVNFREIVTNNKESITLLTESNENISKKLNVANTKLKVQRRLTMFGVPVALGVGFVVGILLR